MRGGAARLVFSLVFRPQYAALGSRPPRHEALEVTILDQVPPTHEEIAFRSILFLEYSGFNNARVWTDLG